MAERRATGTLRRREPVAIARMTHLLGDAQRYSGRSLAIIAILCSCWLFGALTASAFEFTNPPKDVSGSEDGPDKVAVAVPLVTISAPKGISVNIASDQPSTTSLAGGPKITYEKIVLAADAMDFSQSTFPGTTTSVLDHGRILSGPDGPKPDRVILDTRLTELPRMGFHGLLTPVSAHITRLEPEAKAPLVAHYRILLTSLGDFSGDLRNGSEWLPHEGWADHGEIDAIGEITENGLSNLRPHSITLYGSDKQGDKPIRKAVVRRLGQQVQGKQADAAGAKDKTVEMQAFGSKIVVLFSDDGKLGNIMLGDDAEVTGDLMPLGGSKIKK